MRGPTWELHAERPCGFHQGSLHTAPRLRLTAPSCTCDPWARPSLLTPGSTTAHQGSPKGALFLLNALLWTQSSCSVTRGRLSLPVLVPLWMPNSLPPLKMQPSLWQLLAPWRNAQGSASSTPHFLASFPGATPGPLPFGFCPQVHVHSPPFSLCIYIRGKGEPGVSLARLSSRTLAQESPVKAPAVKSRLPALETWPHVAPNLRSALLVALVALGISNVRISFPQLAVDFLRTRVSSTGARFVAGPLLDSSQRQHFRVTPSSGGWLTEPLIDHTCASTPCMLTYSHCSTLSLAAPTLSSTPLAVHIQTPSSMSVAP